MCVALSSFLFMFDYSEVFGLTFFSCDKYLICNSICHAAVRMNNFYCNRVDCLSNGWGGGMKKQKNRSVVAQERREIGKILYVASY